MTTLLKAKAGTSARQKLFHTFHIDFDSFLDDRKYTGRFTTKKLTLQDVSTLGVRKAQLNGGMHFDASNPGRGIDQTTDEYNTMVAHLEIALVEAPKWWDLSQIVDSELLGAVYEEVMTFENSFLERAVARREQSQSGGVGEGNSASAASQANVVGELSQVVGEEVQSSLEP
jgi:hypothetical protein